MTQPNFPISIPKPKWATEIPTRRPKFKIHNTLGQAKNAITYHSGTHIYYDSVGRGGWYNPGMNSPQGYNNLYWRVFEFVDGEWEYRPEFSVDPGITHNVVGYQSTTPYGVVTKHLLKKKE